MSVQRERFELKVGVFVFVGIAALGALILLLGSKKDMFSRQYPLYAEFEQVAGLKIGAPVRLSGVDVGVVDGISFPDDPSSRRLKVRLLVRTSVRDRIRQDSRASITTQGVLGDKYIKVSLGTVGEPLRRSSMLPSEKQADYLALADSAGDLVGRLTSIATKIDVALSSGSSGEAVKSLGGVFARVEDMLEEIQTGDGLLHTLIYDDDAAKSFRDLQTASANLAEITAALKDGDGALPALLDDPKTKESLTRAMAAMANMEKATADAAQAAADLRAVMGRVEKGEGTLGALVNDPGVYDDLRALLGRAQRNRVLRGVIRHTIERNEEVGDTSASASTKDSPKPKGTATPTP